MLQGEVVLVVSQVVRVVTRVLALVVMLDTIFLILPHVLLVKEIAQHVRLLMIVKVVTLDFTLIRLFLTINALAALLLIPSVWHVIVQPAIHVLMATILTLDLAQFVQLVLVFAQFALIQLIVLSAKMDIS